MVNLSAPPVAPQFCGGVVGEEKEEKGEGERERAREGGEGLTDLLSSGLLHELLFYVVYNVVGEGKGEPQGGEKGWSYFPLLRETMQLIVLALQNEARHQEKLSSSRDDSSPTFSLAEEKAPNFGKLLTFDDNKKVCFHSENKSTYLHGMFTLSPCFVSLPQKSWILIPVSQAPQSKLSFRDYDSIF